MSPEEEQLGSDPSVTSNVHESDVLDNSESSIIKEDQQVDVNLEGEATKETNENLTENINDQAQNNNNNESEAPTSERAASGFIDSPFGSPRVQFEKIKEEGSTSPNHEEPADEDRKGRRHREHK